MKKTIAIIMLLSCLLCACDAGYSRISAGASDYDDAIQIVRAAVPHVGEMDLRLDIVKLLEEDDYGRRLFSYSMSTARMRILVVCQKTDDSLTYYYEDDCYIMCPWDNSDFKEEYISWLKKQNDWNLPLNENKMRAVNYISGQDDVVDYLDTSNSIQAYLQKGYPEYNVVLNGLETDPNGNQLILAEFCHEETNSIEHYLFLYCHENPSCVIAYARIASGCDFREAIISFKQTYCKIKDGYLASISPQD